VGGGLCITTRKGVPLKNWTQGVSSRVLRCESKLIKRKERDGSKKESRTSISTSEHRVATCYRGEKGDLLQATTCRGKKRPGGYSSTGRVRSPTEWLGEGKGGNEGWSGGGKEKPKRRKNQEENWTQDTSRQDRKPMPNQALNNPPMPGEGGGTRKKT